MGTRNSPAPYDCWSRLADDEPYFLLMARDSSAPLAIIAWVGDRLDRIKSGERRADDLPQLREALTLSRDMVAWQRAHPRPNDLARTVDFDKVQHALDEAAALL